MHETICLTWWNDGWVEVSFPLLSTTWRERIMSLWPNVVVRFWAISDIWLYPGAEAPGWMHIGQFSEWLREVVTDVGMEQKTEIKLYQYLASSGEMSNQKVFSVASTSLTWEPHEVSNPFIIHLSFPMQLGEPYWLKLVSQPYLFLPVSVLELFSFAKCLEILNCLLVGLNQSEAPYNQYTDDFLQFSSHRTISSGNANEDADSSLLLGIGNAKAKCLASHYVEISSLASSIIVFYFIYSLSPRSCHEILIKHQTGDDTDFMAISSHWTQPKEYRLRCNTETFHGSFIGWSFQCKIEMRQLSFSYPTSRQMSLPGIRGIVHKSHAS